jgi:hypothetical protein
VHDFESVAGLDARLLPKRARKDIEIALDGHAADWHPEVLDQRSDVEAIGNFSALAIDRDSHLSARNYEPAAGLVGGTFWRERIVKRISSLAASAFA